MDESTGDIYTYANNKWSNKTTTGNITADTDATIQYLVDRGISRSRLTGKGYGETQLVNHCSNGVKCSDWVHEQNRRSEFIITRR